MAWARKPERVEHVLDVEIVNGQPIWTLDGNTHVPGINCRIEEHLTGDIGGVPATVEILENGDITPWRTYA